MLPEVVAVAIVVRFEMVYVEQQMAPDLLDGLRWWLLKFSNGARWLATWGRWSVRAIALIFSRSAQGCRLEFGLVVDQGGNINLIEHISEQFRLQRRGVKDINDGVQTAEAAVFLEKSDVARVATQTSITCRANALGVPLPRPLMD